MKLDVVSDPAYEREVYEGEVNDRRVRELKPREVGVQYWELGWARCKALAFFIQDLAEEPGRKVAR
jgi:hypothetical protein